MTAVHSANLFQGVIVPDTTKPQIGEGGYRPQNIEGYERASPFSCSSREHKLGEMDWTRPEMQNRETKKPIAGIDSNFTTLFERIKII